MKAGVTSLADTNRLIREEMENRALADEETVRICFKDGHSKYLNIHIEGGIAIIRHFPKRVQTDLKWKEEI